MFFNNKDKALKKELMNLKKGMTKLRVNSKELKISSFKLRRRIVGASIFTLIGMILSKILSIVKANSTVVASIAQYNAAQATALVTATTVTATSVGVAYKKVIAPFPEKEIIKQEEKKVEEEKEKITINQTPSQTPIVIKNIPQEKLQESPPIKEDISIKNLVMKDCKFILLDGTEIQGKIIKLDMDNVIIETSDGKIIMQPQAFIFKTRLR